MSLISSLNPRPAALGSNNTFEPPQMLMYEKNMYDPYIIWAVSQGNLSFEYAKTKAADQVNVQLISAYVFITSLDSIFLNPKFKASSYFLWLYVYNRVCVWQIHKPI